MGLLDRFLGKKRRPVDRRYDDRYPEQDHDDKYDYDGPEETDAASLLVDHHLEFIPGKAYAKDISSMEYIVEIENGTDFPMGNIRVEFPRSTKLLKFGKPEQDMKMLDPDEKMTIRVPAIPKYAGGKDDFEFEILFFDFKYKVEERVVLKSEPIKVVVPKFTTDKMDEDGYRFLTGELFRWTSETDTIKRSPKELYHALKERFISMGFSEANELYSESGFRGISQLSATDRKGRKWAAQIQVIGGENEAKLLLYTYGERPHYAYNLAVKEFLKIEDKEKIITSIIL